jgi:hypothetical protein
VDTSLPGRDEARPEPSGVGTECEDGGEAVPVTDTAGGDHRAVDGVDDVGNERHRRHVALEVTVRFDALGDAGVDARVGGRTCLGPASDGLPHVDAGVVCPVDVRDGVAEGEREDVDVGVETRPDQVVRRRVGSVGVDDYVRGD